jgi:hypothetical protein
LSAFLTNNLLFAVCNNGFECLSGSDHRLCPGYKCKNMDNYFQCQDEKFCILDHFLCDGHVQCDDGSDEAFCSVCPRVNSTLQRRNTFPCKHRYTKRTICANPCDGYDDLCEDFSDEDCKGISVIWILYWVACLTLIVSVTTIIMEKFTSVITKDKKTNIEMTYSIQMFSLVKEETSGNFNIYMTIRTDRDFVNSLCMTILHFKLYGNNAKAKTIIHHYYSMELTYNQSQPEFVNEHYFNMLGTNNSTAYIYDILDNSLAIKISSLLAKICPKFVFSVFTSTYFKITIIHVMFFIRIVLYYADLAKDIVLIRQIWKHMIGNSIRTFLFNISEFPEVVIMVMITSIITTELLAIHTLIHSATYGRFGKFKKHFALLVFPLIPSIVMYQQLKLEIKLLFMLSNEKTTKIKALYFKTCQNEIEALVSLKSNLKANENVAEHFPQLVILLLILALRKTITPTVAKMDNIFLNDNELFIVLSTSWSFFSLLKGLLFYIEATKCNFVTSLGQIILLLYFVIGMSGRLLSTILFFTPLLGLFDTNYHGVLGSVKPKMYLPSVKKKMGLLFDYIDNNKPILFADAWVKKIITETELFKLPLTLFLFIIAVIIFHLVTGVSIKLKVNKHSKEKTTTKILQTLYTLLCPPLFLDWEGIYRDGKGSITFKESWKKSQKLLLFYILIHFIEHIVLCIPLMLFKKIIDKRNEQLSDLFPPLNDELYSTLIVNLLFGIGITVAVVLPPIQYGLAHLYFVHGHSWSRLLNAKLRSK